MPDDFPSEQDRDPSGVAGSENSGGGLAEGGGAGAASTGPVAPGDGASGGSAGAAGAGGAAGAAPDSDDENVPDAGPPPGDAGTEVGDGGS